MLLYIVCRTSGMLGALAAAAAVLVCQVGFCLLERTAVANCVEEIYHHKTDIVLPRRYNGQVLSCLE